MNCKLLPKFAKYFILKSALDLARWNPFVRVILCVCFGPHIPLQYIHSWCVGALSVSRWCSLRNVLRAVSGMHFRRRFEM